MDENLMLFDEELVPEEVLTLAGDIRAEINAILDAYITDEAYEDDLRNILEEDDYLTEELVDKIAYLNLLEAAPEGEIPMEDTEQAYLSVIDSFFELSKMISPMNGFGRDRLEAGLSLIRQFEERYWQIATRIVPENAEAFSELISVEHYEDILAGRKQAIGALRHIGDEVYAAGAVVYSVYDDPKDEPYVTVDWVMVHEDMRGQGIGNQLMAQVIDIALTLARIDRDNELSEKEEASILVELPVRQAEDEEELRVMDTVENYFDSWKFGFTMDYSSRFIIKLSDVGESDVIKGMKDSATNGVKSLGKLRSGAEILKEFFKKQDQSFDAGLAALPYDYFDPDVSCVTLSGKELHSILLFHRFDNGDYRYECFRCMDDEDSADLPKLITYAYEAAIRREDGDHMISGSFVSEEGYDTAGRLIPNARVPMIYRGVMYPPDEIITSGEWGELRIKAGLSNDKIPEEELADEEPQD
ncbi:MAG: GNAT family N-acetyltransferase [Lachnospiraceae bacterium]|nr:GNAT family N-acetyltransferase [Lachnospiraceae bacterium]MBR1856883.1 GNAT family N-acetyltransferase [Oribacterium sp.]